MSIDNKKINIEYDYMWFVGNKYNFTIELSYNMTHEIDKKKLEKRLKDIDYQKYNKKTFKKIKEELKNKSLINDFDKNKVQKIDELENKINELNFKTIVIENNKIKNNRTLVVYDNTELYDYIINEFITSFWINKEGNQKQLNELESRIENILFETNKECILAKINEINVNNNFNIYQLKNINKTRLNDNAEKQM